MLGFNENSRSLNHTFHGLFGWIGAKITSDREHQE